MQRLPPLGHDLDYGADRAASKSSLMAGSFQSGLDCRADGPGATEEVAPTFSLLILIRLRSPVYFH